MRQLSYVAAILMAGALVEARPNSIQLNSIQLTFQAELPFHVEGGGSNYTAHRQGTHYTVTLKATMQQELTIKTESGERIMRSAGHLATAYGSPITVQVEETEFFTVPPVLTPLSVVVPKSVSTGRISVASRFGKTPTGRQIVLR